MPGFSDDITSVLQSPLVQQLLPTIAGAVGGVLTTPRRAGFGGALGQGLLGGAAGLSEGSQAYQNAQHLALVNQQVMQAMAERKKDQPTLAKVNKALYGGPLLAGVLPGDIDVSNLDPDTSLKLTQSGLQLLEARAKGQKPNIEYKPVEIGGKPMLVQLRQDPGGGPPQQTIVGPIPQDPAKVSEEQAAAQAHLASAAVSRARVGPEGTLLPPPESPDVAARNLATAALARARVTPEGTLAPPPETPAQQKAAADRRAVRQEKYRDDVMTELHNEYNDYAKTFRIEKPPAFEDWLKTSGKDVEQLVGRRAWMAGDLMWPDSFGKVSEAAQWLSKQTGMSYEEAVAAVKASAQTFRR